MRSLIFVLLALTLTISGCQDSGRAAQQPPVRAANFDFYVLSLSWAPAYCAHAGENRSSRECDPHRAVGFVVHGLWPQRNDDGRLLEFCAHVPPVSHAIVEDMLDIMPDRSLIQHEWRAHGSCSSLPPREYFATVRRALARVKIPSVFPPHRRPMRVSPSDIERDFESSTGIADAQSVRIGCRDGEFTEVRVCLSKSLQPVPCGPSVRECRQSSLLVRAIR